jgi:hypothetical protein
MDKEAQDYIQDDNNIQINTLDEPVMDTVVLFSLDARAQNGLL